MREYDLIAEWYATQRVGPIGVPETLAMASSLAAGSLVLDLGCGNGVPISRALLDAGHRVIGIDSSREMIRRFKATVPAVGAVRGLVQDCGFARASFDAAVSWGVFFHLRRPDFVKLLAGVARILKPGAPFLFTGGDADAEQGIEGTMNGVTFRYYSGSDESHRTLLQEHGFTLLDVHADAGDNTYYLARKSSKAD
jgi:cyclopropane fatty-acyl-phospholipid synthase-like methyltransferase